MATGTKQLLPFKSEYQVKEPAAKKYATDQRLEQSSNDSLGKDIQIHLSHKQ